MRQDSHSPGLAGSQGDERPQGGARDALELAMGIPFVDGNRVAVFNNGQEIFPAMLRAIDTAECSIDFETFVYWRGEIATRFAEALAERARAGVRVRVLLDSYGARRMRAKLADELEAAGCELRWFRPLSTWRLWRSDKRTHRKILVCDQQVGFTGGVGIAEQWQGDARTPGEWRDVQIRLDGPAVGGLRAAFVENWNEAGPWSWDSDLEIPKSRADGVPVQIVRASATVGWTDVATLMRSLVSLARRRLRVTTAYFVPDSTLVELLETAVERGVEVEIIVPGRYTDSRLSQLAGLRSVERLLAAGVRFHRYERTTLHTKCLTVDGTLACVGSANLNHRSLGKDEECCAVVADAAVAEALDRAFDRDLEHASLWTLERLRERGVAVRVGEWLARRFVEEL